MADPSEEAVLRYIVSGRVFVGKMEGTVIATAVLEKNEQQFEIKNIAVDPKHQGKGYGKLMLSHLIQFAIESKAQEVFLGTGNSSLSQLAFYQKMGFRITGVIPDYFAGYDPPVFENEIRCLDRLILTYKVPHA